MIIEIQPDPVGEAIAKINRFSEEMAEHLARRLTDIVQTGAAVNATFWSDPRIGTNGKALLQKLKAHIGLLANYHPGKLNGTLINAGSTLTENDDGTVTHTSPAE